MSIVDPPALGRRRARSPSATATGSIGGVGLAISAVGFGCSPRSGTDSGYWQFLVATLVIGVGAPLAMTPATNAIVASLPRAKQGVASAVNDTAREIGAAFGVAVLGQRVQHRLPQLDRVRPRRAARRRSPTRRARRRRSRSRSHGDSPTAPSSSAPRRRRSRAACAYAVLLGMGLLLRRRAVRLVPRRVPRRGGPRGRARRPRGGTAARADQRGGLKPGRATRADPEVRPRAGGAGRQSSRLVSSGSGSSISGLTSMSRVPVTITLIDCSSLTTWFW